ncbi:hypothetical protein ACFFJY_12360 [Fictibacillus aquaticus]|uniref:Uncharacterized protein n=1 Tax=Fictibacillus aquaticus TaxID=2021314 RepID=A0A235FE53_9BACL|nr:hypothetical protein [Fictibacillus aquaticus]OYD59035.1 hypothetical protein CGZ90_03795 [Fictibacillus aquaticus]
MQELYYNSKKICTVTENEYSQFKLLCPYWGLSLIDKANVILGALSTFMIGVHGLSQKKFEQLSQLLQHTGVSLTENRLTPAIQHMHIVFESVHHMPISIKTDSGNTFYLNPIKPVQDTPVQSAIHKQIYLKPKKGDLYITVNAEYEENICEYISYIIIQRCIKEQFQTLSSVSSDIFYLLNQNALSLINPVFADVQKLAFSEPETQMSILPPKVEKKEEPAAIEEDQWESCDTSVHTTPQALSRRRSLQGTHPINPFRQNSGPVSPIAPFQSGAEKKNSAVIRPFHLN